MVDIVASVTGSALASGLGAATGAAAISPAALPRIILPRQTVLTYDYAYIDRLVRSSQMFIDRAQDTLNLVQNGEVFDPAGTADAAVAAHVAEADPHVQYLLETAAALLYQPLDADLTAIAALSTTSYGRDFLVLANGPAALTYINAQPLDATLTAFAAYNTNGLLTQTAADTFTGRTVTGTTNQITVANGNGVSGNPTLALDMTALDARWQPLDSDLTTIAGLTATTDNFLQASASAWASRTPTQAMATLQGVTKTLTNTTFDADGTGNSITNIENADIKAAAAIDATKIGAGLVSSTEFGYLDGVTSAIQGQIDLKAPLASPTLTGVPAAPTAAGGTNTTQIATTAFVGSAITTAGASYQPLDATLTAWAAFNTNGILTQTAADTFTGRTITGTANEITATNGSGVSGNPTLSLPSALTFTGKTVTGGTFTGITDIAIADGGTGASNVTDALKNLNTWNVLLKSGVAINHTGTTSTTIIATLTIPANSLAANGRIRGRFSFSITNNANNKTILMEYGGSTVRSQIYTTATKVIWDFDIVNRGATNSQIAQVSDALNTGTPSITDAALAIDTTIARNILLRVTLANSGDTVTLEHYLIEGYYST